MWALCIWHYLDEISIVDQLRILQNIVDYVSLYVRMFRLFGVHRKRSEILDIEYKHWSPTLYFCLNRTKSWSSHPDNLDRFYLFPSLTITEYHFSPYAFWLRLQFIPCNLYTFCIAECLLILRWTTTLVYFFL